MKKSSFLVASLLFCGLIATSCGGSTSSNEGENDADSTAVADETVAEGEYDTFPWDFPESQKIVGNPGDWALSCYTYYPIAVEKKKDLTKESLIYYSSEIEEIGEKTTKLSNREIPNSLVIPIPAGQTAKKGDIVLTWWQSGSGLKRAIVTDATNPAEPKVCYLDMNWKEDGSGFAQKYQDQLKPNSFIVLKDGTWEPGAEVALKSNGDKATIVALTDKKVLCLGFASKLVAYDRADCVLIPAKEDIKVGDAVKAVFVSGFRDGYKVVDIDETYGRIKVEKEKSSQTEYLSLYEVTKVLN